MNRRACGKSSSLLTLLAVALLCLTGSFAAPNENAGGVAPQHRVTLKVYFRAFCPACQWFVADPLLELMRNEQFRNVVNLKLFPAAGMAERHGELTCDGGSLECTGHRLEVCLIDKDRNDVVKYLGNVACLEGDESGRPGDWSEKMKNCFTPEERAVVDTCYKTKADDLLREMIHKEKASSVDWMPFVIVEERVLGSASEGVGLGEVQASVCSAYKGPKQFYPEACSKLVGDQKQVAADVQDDTAAKAPLNNAAVTPAVAAAAPAAVAAPAAAQTVEGEELELEVKEEVAVPTGKLRLDIYWRAFCPGCMAFIGNPLLKLLRNEQFRNSIDFRPVPAAGTSLDESGKFVCSMGLVECMGHKWMSCAIDLFPKVEELIEHLACMESKDNKGVTWSFVVNKCFPGEGAKKMQTCYDTRGDDLLKKHIVEREKIDVLWVPYVLINGAPIGDARHGIGYKQLSDEVCKGYSGPPESLPTECQPKRLRVDQAVEKAEKAKETATEPAIKPCPPKKDKKPAAAVASPVDADEDAPGIGARIETDHQMANAFAANNTDGKRPDNEDAASSLFSGPALMVPCVFIVVVGFAAFRFFSGDHKKHA
jgi:interferon gamma-inducible protein 30